MSQPQSDQAAPSIIDTVREELDRSNKYLEFAQGQIEKDRTFYKHLYTLVTGFLLVMVASAGFFQYTNVSQMRNDMKASVDATLESVRTEVKSRIDTEFKTENINNLVEKAAKERTESELTRIIKSETQKYASEINAIRDSVEAERLNIKKVSRSATEFEATISDLTKKNDIANEKLEQITQTLFVANTAVRNLSTISDVYLNVISAQGDNIDSFYKLRSLANEQGFLYHEIARLAFESIQRDAENTMFGRSIQWEKLKIDPSKLWLSELIRFYKEADEQPDVYAPFNKVALIQYISSRADISETSRLEFLSNIMREDKSLKAVAYAGDSFAKLAKIDFRPLATKEMLDWWENNKDRLP
jgi:hypothetical protein